MCKNTSKTAPDKVFFYVPKSSLRNKWCKAMRRKKLSCLSTLYCCEDHFNIEKDTENYVQYKIMALELGQKVTLRLKKEIVPYIFQCQKKDKVRLPRDSNYAMKRKRQALVEEALTEYNLLWADPSIASICETDASTASEPYPMDVKLNISDNKEDVASASNMLLSNEHCLFIGSRSPSPPTDALSKEILQVDKAVQVNCRVHYRSKGVNVNLTTKKNNIAEHSRQIYKFSHEIQCNVCNEDIRGFRYTCVQCLNEDLCSKCEALQLHATHYVLRVPPDRPQEEVSEVVLQVRGCLARLVPGSAPAPDEPEVTVKMEIKEEVPDDPLAQDPDCRPHATNILEQTTLSLDLPATTDAQHTDTASDTSTAESHRRNKRLLAPEEHKIAPKILKPSPLIETLAPKMRKIAPKILKPSPLIEILAPQMHKCAPKILKSSSHIKTVAPQMHKTAPKILKPFPYIETPAPQLDKPAPMLQMLKTAPLNQSRRKQTLAPRKSALETGKNANLSLVETDIQTPNKNKTFKVLTMKRKSDSNHTDTSLQAGASKSEKLNRCSKILSMVKPSTNFSALQEPTSSSSHNQLFLSDNENKSSATSALQEPMPSSSHSEPTSLIHDNSLELSLPSGRDIDFDCDESLFDKCYVPSSNKAITKF